MKNDNQLSEPVLAAHRRMLAFLQGRVSGQNTADKILHTAYVRGGQEGNELRDEDKIVPWYYRLLRAALDGNEYRREGMDRDLKKLVSECVADLVETLKPEYMNLIKKAELEEKSLKDLAHQARTSPVDIKLRLHRARESLKKKMLQTYGACATHGSLDCACHRPAFNANRD